MQYQCLKDSVVPGIFAWPSLNNFYNELVDRIINWLFAGMLYVAIPQRTLCGSPIEEISAVDAISRQNKN